MVVPGEVVREVRKALQVKDGWRTRPLTQAEFAALLGVSKPTVERMEQNGANTYDRLALIGVIISHRPAVEWKLQQAILAKLDQLQLELAS